MWKKKLYFFIFNFKKLKLIYKLNLILKLNLNFKVNVKVNLSFLLLFYFFQIDVECNG